MFSAQARTGKPLVNTDVNRTIRPTEEAERAGEGWGVTEAEGAGSGKPKILTEVAGLCSVQKNWLMNKN